jgi:hypothetical protein
MIAFQIPTVVLIPLLRIVEPGFDFLSIAGASAYISIGLGTFALFALFSAAPRAPGE